MKKIVIIGAGISGLYLANLLQRTQKYEYLICEKRSNFDLNDSYGIQLSVNSIKLLNDIGFKNIPIHDVFFPKNVNFFDANTNKNLCSIDISKFNFGNNFYTTLKRSTLVKFLLDNIPLDKIINSCEPKNIDYSENIKVSFSNNLTKEFDYLVVSDGVFSKTKSMILKNDNSIKFFKSVALRGNVRDINTNDISIYLGSNFHFVTYPVNQKKEFNFISIVRKNLTKEEFLDENLFKNRQFLESLTSKIFKKTSLDLDNKLENIKSFPVFVSKKFYYPRKKNIFFVGDSLFAFPPSFAQGASQSIEAAKDLFEEIENNKNKYYSKRHRKIKIVSRRSQLNHFVFHLSNPIAIFIRNLFLKYLTKNNKFLENYLGKIYRN